MGVPGAPMLTRSGVLARPVGRNVYQYTQRSGICRATPKGLVYNGALCNGRTGTPTVETAPLINQLEDLQRRTEALRGYL